MQIEEKLRELLEVVLLPMRNRYQRVGRSIFRRPLGCHHSFCRRRLVCFGQRPTCRCLRCSWASERRRHRSCLYPPWRCQTAWWSQGSRLRCLYDCRCCPPSSACRLSLCFGANSRRLVASRPLAQSPSLMRWLRSTPWQRLSRLLLRPPLRPQPMLCLRRRRPSQKHHQRLRR